MSEADLSEQEKEALGLWNRNKVSIEMAMKILALEEQVKELRESGALLLSVVENIPISQQEYALTRRFRAALARLTPPPE